MEVIYGKQLTEQENLQVIEIAKECDILYDTAKLLFYREIDTIEKVKRFLSPSKSRFYNPFLLSGMHDAVNRIEKAKNENQNVVVFGDYDADGVCACAILRCALTEYGIKNLRIIVPERVDGYGLNVLTVENADKEEKIDLLITVDCGVSDYQKIEQIKELGIDVIVTDHHEPPEVLPDCVTINPKLVGEPYPFSGLCGAGVAYKLANALLGDKADEYLDLVAIATVADSMELIDENRDIVWAGLKILNNPKTLRLPIKYLLGDNAKTITAQTISYSIAPRINAGGRMGDAKCALQLLTETNPNKAYDLSVKLNGYNVARQVECDKIYLDAKERIKKYSLYKKSVILVKDKTWGTGFTGIVAAKLVEEFSRPVIVFAGQEENLKGSARSIDGVNIHEAISSCKDLLVGFGGHSQAAGVAVTEENFVVFDKALNEHISKVYGSLKTERKAYAEWEINEPISERFAHEINKLEPFGVGNKRPVFSTLINSVVSTPLHFGGAHYSFNTKAVEMLDFNGEGHVKTLSLPIEKRVLFEINVSTYKGRESIKGFVRSIHPDYGDFSSLKLHILNNEIDKLLLDGAKSSEISSLSNVTQGIGTLYVITDPKNLIYYKEKLTLPIYLFEPEQKNYSDCIVVSPKCIPDGYENVIYLDKPMQVMQSKTKNLVVEGHFNNALIERLSVERNDFAQIFAMLKSLNRKEFKNEISFTLKYSDEENAENFLFSLKVFMELKIFYVKNEIFYFDEKVKNALTNSKVYSKIVLLKGQYV